MNAFSRVSVLAQNTIREAVRNKLLYNLLFFAILMIGSSVALAELHIGYRVRIYRDVGLSAIALFGVLIAIFVGINLVHRDLAQRTVYTILATPLRRWEFLLGKYLGLAALLAVQVAAMTAFFLAVCVLTGSEITGGIMQAIGLVYAELLLITAVALFFSSFTTPYLAGMFTVGLWVVGHLLGDLRAFGQHSELPALQQLTEALYWILPNLDRLDLKALAAAGETAEASRVALASAYAAFYSAGMLVSATVLFRRRDFR